MIYTAIPSPHRPSTRPNHSHSNGTPPALSPLPPSISTYTNRLHPTVSSTSGKASLSPMDSIPLLSSRNGGMIRPPHRFNSASSTPALRLGIPPAPLDRCSRPTMRLRQCTRLLVSMVPSRLALLQMLRPNLPMRSSRMSPAPTRTKGLRKESSLLQSSSRSSSLRVLPLSLSGSGELVNRRNVVVGLKRFRRTPTSSGRKVLNQAKSHLRFSVGPARIIPHDPCLWLLPQSTRLRITWPVQVLDLTSPGCRWTFITALTLPGWSSLPTQAPSDLPSSCLMDKSVNLESRSQTSHVPNGDLVFPLVETSDQLSPTPVPFSVYPALQIRRPSSTLPTGRTLLTPPTQLLTTMRTSISRRRNCKVLKPFLKPR